MSRERSKSERLEKRARVLIVSRYIPPMLTGSAAVVGRLRSTLSAAGADLFSAEDCFDSDSKSLDNQEVFPLRKILRFPVILVGVFRRLYQQQTERVMGVFPDGYHFLASAIGSCVLGIPYFPYLHNSFAENRTGWRGFFAKGIVSLVFSISKKVFLMSDGLLRFYETHYPNHQFVALLHQYEPIDENLEAVTKKKGTVAMIGAVNESNVESSLRVLDAFNSLNDVELFLYTSTPDHELKSFGILNFKNVQVVRKSSYPKFMHAIAGSEIVILTHGFTGGMSEIEYETIFPTRTLDLLASGRPVIAHVPKKSFIYEFLTRSKCALIVEKPKVSAIMSAYRLLLEDQLLQQSITTAARQALKEFEPQRIRSTCLSEMNLKGDSAEVLVV